jgi:lambda family phage portal protein
MPNVLDKVINYVAPVWAFKRARARSAALVMRKYEAASSATRLSGWSTAGTSADAEICPALTKLRSRARDLCRNNEFAKKARNSIAAYIVGSGIVPKAIGEDKRAGELNRLWKLWGEKLVCDFDGQNNFYGLQTLACNTIVESGAFLAKKNVTRPNKKNPIGLEVQILEPDFISLSTNSLAQEADKAYIKQGIEFDKNGKRIAYILLRDHPGEQRMTKGDWTLRVPCEEIAHVFLKERPGQNHGVPWFSTVAMRLKDFGDYEDAQLMRQKIAACFAGFIRDLEMPDTTDSTAVMEKIQPGRLELLPPGKDIVFAAPPGVSGYSEYGKSQKQAIAAGLGITYEVLTSDLSNVNFSSARIGQGDMYMNVEQWRWQMLIPHFCEVVWGWFEEACEITGLVPVGETQGANWTAPKREFVNPVDDANAIKAQVRSGFKTPSEAVREHGYDPETHWQEYASDLAKLDELGIVLDIDPRQGPGNGASMPAQEESEQETESDILIAKEESIG